MTCGMPAASVGRSFWSYAEGAITLACMESTPVPTARCTAFCLLDACASLTRRPVRLCRDAANMTRLKHPGGPSAFEPLFAEAERSLEPHASHCGLQAL